MGVGHPDFWEAICQGKSGIAPITLFDTSAARNPYGGQVWDFDPKPFVKQRKSLKLMSRDIRFAVAATEMALSDAKLDTTTLDPERFGVDFGAHTMHTELEEMAPAYQRCIVDGKFDFSRWGEHYLKASYPLWMLKYLPNMPACQVAIIHDARGPNNSVVQNEAGSLLAISEAVRVIERGHADVMVAGGTGSRLPPKYWVSLSVFDRLSKHTGDPAESMRPFDLRRSGQVHGEGAAAFILESRAHAEARGARPLVRIHGTGSACEAARPNTPLSGRGLQAAMDRALHDAGIAPLEVGHVNANGLSTPDDDRAEAAAIHQLLGAEVPVTAPKSYFGNLGAGTGAVQLAASVLALQHDLVPPTRNYGQPDPECPINVIHGEPLHGAAPTALVVNQTSFGQAVAIVLGK